MNENTNYDAVIVGAGIAGAIVAKELSAQGKRVLILEAGKNTGKTWLGYQEYMATFFEELEKIPNAPFPQNPNAPQPLVTDPFRGQDGYFIQKGPKDFGSTYTRSAGGTTLHWLGTCLRMLPEDFELQSRYGRGLDWPISYGDLEPFYRMAENEIGVSADVKEQSFDWANFEGPHFNGDYLYPMVKIPASYLDNKLGERLNGQTVNINGEEVPLQVSGTPAGRNSMPTPGYVAPDGKNGFMPVGAVGNPDVGQRCDGNSNCVPICPVQAKYNALKTLDKLDDSLVEIRPQSVVTRVLIGENGRATGVEYKAYQSTDSNEYTVHTAEGTLIVLAAHAVENAKILLMSGIEGGPNKLVGKHLMDHPTMLTWALMPEPIGSYRGPGSTSGIPSMRGGRFRSEHAAFRVEIGNWGWSWPKIDPYTSVQELIDHKRVPFITPDSAPFLGGLVERPLFGRELRHFINEKMTRQFRFGFLIEQLPSRSNRVSIDPTRHLDPLGNPRPIIHYDVDEYSWAGMAAAREMSRQIYEMVGARDFTYYDPQAKRSYVKPEGTDDGFSFQGAGHLVGTHIMGTSDDNSVVNARQKVWQHENLYLVGCGNMPTISTSNPTLTLAALSFMAAQHMLHDLGY